MDEKISSIKKNKKNWFKKERKTSFGRTNLNNRYYMGLIKSVKDEFLRKNGERIKQDRPELYYSMINRPLPKKYQKPSYPIAPVNAYVPPQSKLSKEELDLQIKKELELKKEKEAKALAVKQKKAKEVALENYRQRLRKEVSAIYVCRPQDNHRWVSVSSDAYQNRYKKKYEYY
jgi:hypothetical protein